MASGAMHIGYLHFGVFLMPKKRNNNWRYAISPSFREAQHFDADNKARTERQGQVIVGAFANVNEDLYRKACYVVAHLNMREDSQLPVYDEERQMTIDDILRNFGQGV